MCFSFSPGFSLLVCLFFYFIYIPKGAQDLLMAQYSRIIPGGTQRIIWGAKIKPTCCVISLCLLLPLFPLIMIGVWNNKNLSLFQSLGFPFRLSGSPFFLLFIRIANKSQSFHNLLFEDGEFNSPQNSPFLIFSRSQPFPFECCVRKTFV